MWIVLFALRYKYTIAVLAISILLFGVLSARKMSTDIMPQVDAPEIQLVWGYNGLNAREMAAKITSFSEIAVLNNVDDLIEVRSETLNGVGIVKLRFQPYVNMEMALGQVTAASQTILRRMPAGTSPPLVIRTSPSSVPILQLVISSDTLSDSALYDYSRLGLRAQIQSIPGIRLTLPYGGAARSIMVDLNAEALNAFGLSPSDVSRAIGSQNLTLPSGTVREGEREMPISINASPENVEGFLDLPIRSVAGRVVTLRDVASVRDGEAVSNNIARLNGQNAVMVSVLKLGNASTLDIIRGILAKLPAIRAAAPEGLRIEPIFDQSVFVQASINSVLHEIVLVGSLVAFVVLLFLGSWRSTLIVLTSIPLALLSSIIGLKLVGATFNLMTLGGLSLAIGILVDNALVEIENIKRQISEGKPVRQAVIDGARQVAFPEFVSTTGICIVFLPIFLLTGTAAYVFKPLALAVIFAMIASYILSRTLVPTLATMVLPAETRAERAAEGRPPRGLRWFNHVIEHAIDRVAFVQGGILRLFVRQFWIVPVLVGGVAYGGYSAFQALGREFFPVTDAGLMRMFIRVPSGARPEATARQFADIHREIRSIIPEKELLFVVENIGVPIFANLAWVESTAAGPFDGELLVQLAPGHQPSARYAAAIRSMLREKFPDVQAFFRPADATSMTLSAGAPTTFEMRFVGRDVPGNIALARELSTRLKQIPGAADVTLKEVFDLPEYYLEIDRVRAAQLGLTQQDAVNATLAVLGSGGTVAPTFWADPAAGTSYDVQVMVPQTQLRNADQLLNLPVRPAAGGAPVLLGAFATLKERKTAASVSRTTLQPTVTVLANVQDTDIGSVQKPLNAILAELRAKQKPGNRIDVAGQAALMESAYSELLGGLALSAVLIFLVMVINFQSWSLPFVAISGLPLAVSGAFISLYLTKTPLSVPALMGLIMVVGVSTANSILVTSFARDLWAGGMDGALAAVRAATTRLRPVNMTALAMALGVLPMAIGHGEGGEQNAPLGRAIIGGLALGTFASLFVVPYVFSLLKRKPAPQTEDESDLDSEAEPPDPPDSPEGPGRKSPKRAPATAPAPTSTLEGSPVLTKSLTSSATVLALLLAVAAFAPSPAPAAADAPTSGSLATKSSGVKTVKPSRPRAGSGMTKLPARTAAAQEAAIFSRATGVVAERRVDIGDSVAVGDILAVLAAPEVQATIDRARANVEQASSRLDLAKLNLDRLRKLENSQAISEEQLDDAKAAAREAEAALRAAKAEVARLETTQQFLTIKAPFAGVVSDRRVDIGDHVEGDKSSGTPMFRLVRLNELRVLLDAPPAAALAIAPGQKATVEFNEIPGKAYEATVVRSTNVIDTASGTMRIELLMQNPGNALPAGLSGVARVDTQGAASALRLPVNALLVREGQSQVAKVVDGKVAFVPVRVGRNLGKEIEVLSGVSENDAVIMSPNALLVEGQSAK